MMGEFQHSEAIESLLLKKDIFLYTSLVEEAGGLDGGYVAWPAEQGDHDEEVSLQSD